MPLRLLILLCVPLLATSSHAASLQDTSVFVDPELVTGTTTTVLVRVDEALDLFASKPIADATVTASLGAETVVVKTDPSGTAVVRLRVPDAVGSYEVIIDTASPAGRDRVTRSVHVIERRVLQLRTDRTQYQPGQSIRWRTTTLNAVDAKPVAAEVVLELRNAEGTLLWRDTRVNDKAGMAAGEIAMSPSTLGKLSLSARTGAVEATEAIEVKRVTMPRMHLAFEDLTEPTGPNGRISGVVVARYPYGEPVRGTVTVKPGDLMGPLDDRGRFAFTLDVGRPGSTRDIVATVEDGAGRQEIGKNVKHALAPFALAVVPSRRFAAPNTSVDVTIITTRGPDLAPARLALKPTQGTVIVRDLTTPGIVRISATTDAQGRLELAVTATTDDGQSASGQAAVSKSSMVAHIDLAEVVVASGAEIAVEGRWPMSERPVVVTLMRGASAVATTAVTVVDGRLNARLATPRGVFGLCTVRATEVRWDKLGKTIVTTDERSVFITPARLDVHIGQGGALRHAPGTTPALALLVTDERGAPLPGVGIAASVIDERALQLSRVRVDLATTLNTFDALKPRRIAMAQDLATSFARWLASPTAEGRLATRAVIEALDRAYVPKLDYSIEAPTRLSTERDRLVRAERAAVTQLERADAVAYIKVDGVWTPRAELAVLLAEAGWKEHEWRTPWGVPTTFAYARQLTDDLPAIVRQVAERRLASLASALPTGQRAAWLRDPSKQLAALLAKGTIPARLGLDPWGQPILAERDTVAHPTNPARTRPTILLRSVGPDGLARTWDDYELPDALNVAAVWNRGLSYSGFGVGGDSNARLGGTMSRLPGVASVRREDDNVRRRFDETVLWTIGVTTDHEGRARVDVPLADSITGWEVQVEAVAPDGAIGVAKARLETFLPLHVSADTPSTLVVGDRYVVPAIIANHNTTKKLLTVLAEGSGIEVDAEAILELAPGAVVVSDVTLVARAAGEAKVKLTLRDGDQVVDVLERAITIEPIGALVTTTFSDLAGPDGALYSVDVPAAILGQAKARVQVYRDLGDVSSDGFEAMIKEPNGCFEQTSSTTHPNVLLLDIFGTDPRFANARAKARDYVGKGYQRLVSYEVSGTPGGFSLFGRAPASRTLTAYGLIEFTDMARVYAVDPMLLTRTRHWLESEQRADGSWQPDGKLADVGATTAFIAWALAEAGGSDASVDRALTYLERARVTDPYTLGLWANAEALRRRVPVAGPRFASFSRRAEGGMKFEAPPNYTTLMHARGHGADVQLTALGAMRAMRIGAPKEARRALDWLWSARAGQGWSSTHGIMLALRAAQVVSVPRDVLSKQLPLTVDGAPAGVIALNPERGVPGLEVTLAPGQHAVSFAAPEGLRSDLRLEWRTRDAAVAESHGIVVAVRDEGSTTLGGDLTQYVTLTNPGTEAIAMPTVIVPVPPGFQAAPNVSGQGVASTEDVGSALHIYLTELAPGATVELRYKLRAGAECDVMQRPIEAYAYYDPTVRGSSAPQRLTVRARPAPSPTK